MTDDTDDVYGLQVLGVPQERWALHILISAD